jgi:RNA-directed DNA polymerase
MSDIIKTQRSLARKATYHRTHQFEDLYRLICREEWIRTVGRTHTFLHNLRVGLEGGLED